LSKFRVNAGRFERVEPAPVTAQTLTAEARQLLSAITPGDRRVISRDAGDAGTGQHGDTEYFVAYGDGFTDSSLPPLGDAQFDAAAPRLVRQLADALDALTRAREEASGGPYAWRLQGALAAQDARESAAGERCGVSRTIHGCDWPDAMAEAVLARDAQIVTLTAQREKLRTDSRPPSSARRPALTCPACRDGDTSRG
jgi:hypothetical protein